MTYQKGFEDGVRELYSQILLIPNFPFRGLEDIVSSVLAKNEPTLKETSQEEQVQANSLPESIVVPDSRFRILDTNWYFHSFRDIPEDQEKRYTVFYQNIIETNRPTHDDFMNIIEQITQDRNNIISIEKTFYLLPYPDNKFGLVIFLTLDEEKHLQRIQTKNDNSSRLR